MSYCEGDIDKRAATIGGKQGKLTFERGAGATGDPTDNLDGLLPKWSSLRLDY